MAEVESTPVDVTGPPRTGRRCSTRLVVNSLLYGAVIALVIALPTRLVPNSFFRRMTPTRTQDYVFLVVSSALIGFSLALRSLSVTSSRLRIDRAIVGGGFGTLFAVGCPVCNKLVVTLIGTSGAPSTFAPLQPFLGAASVAVVAIAIRRQWKALVVLEGCSIGDTA